MIKTVAFDMDGTLGNTFSLLLEAFREAAAPYVGHRMTDEEVMSTFGPSDDGMMRNTVGEGWEKALDDYVRIYERLHEQYAQLFPGAKELLGWLKQRGVGVVLITGKLDRCLEITLRKFGIQDCFDAIWTGSPDGVNKPANISKMLECFGLSKEDVCYVGDTCADVASCREAGVQCLSVAWNPMSGKDALERVNGGNVFETMDALKQRLEEMTR